METLSVTSPFTYNNYKIVCTNEKYGISEGIFREKMKSKKFDVYGVLNIVFQYPLITRFQIENFLLHRNVIREKDRANVKSAIASLVKSGALLRYYMVNPQSTDNLDDDIMDEVDETHKLLKRTVYFYTVSPGVYVYLKFSTESALFTKEEAKLILKPRDPVRTLRCLCVNTFLSTYTGFSPDTKVLTHDSDYPLYAFHGFGCDAVFINPLSKFKVIHLFGVRRNPGYEEELKSNLQKYIHFALKNPPAELPYLLFIGEDPDHIFFISNVVKACLSESKYLVGRDFYNYDIRIVSEKESKSFLTVYDSNKLGIVEIM